VDFLLLFLLFESFAPQAVGASVADRLGGRLPANQADSVFFLCHNASLSEPEGVLGVFKSSRFTKSPANLQAITGGTPFRSCILHPRSLCLSLQWRGTQVSVAEKDGLEEAAWRATPVAGRLQNRFSSRRSVRFDLLLGQLPYHGDKDAHKLGIELCAHAALDFG
jgi:hypothetical protein